VLENDADVDGDALSAMLVNGPAHGTLTLNANGGFVYAPATNYTGADNFVYKANDGTTDSGVATVVITVTPLNDPPVAVDDSYGMDEDTTLTVQPPGVLTNDTEPDGDSLTGVLVSVPAHGSLTLNANGGFVYTPTNNFTGTDSFTYRANDGQVNGNIATVTITVNPLNDPPVAANDGYTTPEGTALSVSAPGVLINDTDVDGDALSAILVNGPAHGTLTLNADGGFIYAPATNYTGTDSFRYRASDGMEDSELAIVTIMITPINDAPMAVNDDYTTPEDTTLSIPAPGVLLNDSDADGDALNALLISGPANGTLVLDANGSFTYAPATNFTGLDSFTYRANDSTSDSALATVSINVTPVNDAPVVADDNFSTPEDTLLTIAAPGVLNNDTDPDGDSLSALLLGGPAHGTLTLNANGSFVYMPATNYNGSDSFTYKANDGLADSGAAIASITVTPVNDPPDTNNWSGRSFTVFEDTTLNVTVPGVLAGITDPDGDTLSAALVSGPTQGTLNLNANGSFTYIPATNYHGPDSFEFRASDGQAFSPPLLVNITVVPVNDAPSFTKGGNQFHQRNAGPQILTGWATDISPGPTNESSQSVSFELSNDDNALFSAQPAVNANGTLTYTPAPDAWGVATVTVAARDNGGTANGGVDSSEPQTFSILVNAPPTVSIVSPTNGASFFVPGSFTLLADAQDVDGTIEKVELFADTNKIAEANSGAPYFTVLTNVPVGTYTYGAVATDNHGATGTATPVTVTVLERPPVTFLTSVYYNPQTDFFEQRLRIHNPTYSLLDAVRICVYNLTNTPAITVHNRSGYTGSVPYVQTHAAVPPGSFVDMTVEFHSPMRIKPNPILEAELVPPATGTAIVPGTPRPINRVLMLANRTVMIEFPTLSNRLYSIQYSSNLVHWWSVEPAISGNGNWVQWIDNGQPKTDGPPATQPARFYRLMLLP
jgi:VCBS repeat-containing protein